MAEATAAPVRALMHGRLCHPGLGGGDRGWARPRALSPARVCDGRSLSGKGHRGPQRRATPGLGGTRV